MRKLGMTYRYSYEELWQPKNFPVIFRMYQLNLNGLSRRNNRLRVRLQVFYEMIGCLVPIFPVHELVVAIQV